MMVLVAGASFSHLFYLFRVHYEFSIILYPLYNINLGLILDPRDVF